DEVLSEDVRVLNQDFNIDPESSELTGGTITLTVKDALKQMITISHNYSALLLTKRIKLSNVAKFLETNGFKDSSVGGSGDSPKSTADDIALFFEKLYKGELANTQYTKEMLDLLKAQTLNDKLPKYLPKGTVVAHKTGEIDYLSHDGGIVYTPKGDYIIVVLSESEFPSGAEDRIAQISKSVFNYFAK
ncbi:MAG: Beta-lactamase, partial [Candidatus Levybacteria bacterium GW2011_GWC2_37_7]